MTIFAQVKSSVSIMDAAQRYGLTINRYKKAICPYHNDSKPSLSFKNERFKCFSCGASGDVIDLVSCLTNSEPLVAVQELSDAYHLGIDVSKPVDSGIVLKARQRQERKKAFEAWEHDAANTYAEYFRLLREWKCDYAPKSQDDELNPRYVEALTKLEHIEYICDSVFICGDLPTKKRFYCNCKADVLAVKKRLNDVHSQNTGQLLLWHPRIGVFSERQAA